MNRPIVSNLYRSFFQREIYNRNLIFLAENHVPSLKNIKPEDNILTALVFLTPFAISVSAFYWLLKNKSENGTKEGKQNDNFIPPRF